MNSRVSRMKGFDFNMKGTEMSDFDVEFDSYQKSIAVKEFP